LYCEGADFVHFGLTSANFSNVCSCVPRLEIQSKCLTDGKNVNYVESIVIPFASVLVISARSAAT